MQLSLSNIAPLNEQLMAVHQRTWQHTAYALTEKGLHPEQVINQLSAFQVAIPSWALGTGGTRFGRFPRGGEPRNIEEKLEDVALLHALTGACGAVSLHIPWDIPQDHDRLRAFATHLGIGFDAVNSNTFQDQPGQPLSYKFGSLAHTNQAVRQQAVAHNLEVIHHGRALGSKALTVWLADGSDFPGQQSFRGAFSRTLDSLEKIYAALPPDWKMLIEYKPYEPHFYSMAIPDWGTSLLLCQKLGHQADVLVDLGHHLPNTNIEQIVARLLAERRLGGFHFNGSMYGDDDLTVGAIKPLQLFLIFAELTDGEGCAGDYFGKIAWMIDASHNIKDPLEDLLQSVQQIRMAYAKSLLIDRQALTRAREENDAAAAQEIIQDAFLTDVRPLLAEAARRKGNALNPIEAFRHLNVRQHLVAERGADARAGGL